MMLTAAELQPMLSLWMPSQRWFAGKGRDFVITPRRLAVVSEGPPEFSIWLADVRFTGGTTETYQLPLVVRDEPVSSLDHVQLGTITSPESDESGGSIHWVYDALHDHETTRAYLVGLRDQATDGVLRFERFAEPELLPLDSESLVLTGEQSNTSLIYGDQAILKVFRRLEYGLNPDIEVQIALGKLGARHVARLLGAVTADIDGQPVSLAMLQEFMSTGTDGWELTKTSVRDLMGEADLHADEAGGDFASEAFRLGVAVAEVHADLARAFGVGELGPAEQRARSRAMHARLDLALTIVPELAAVETGLRLAFDEFAAVSISLTTQRIHGDLHLGQALRTVHRWVLLDFEGEPTSSMAQRKSFDSPLRDVAGMLRSFDYAARYPLLDAPASPQLEYRAIEWAERNRDAFCDGYSSAGCPDLREETTAATIRGFEADKAVYEAVYEARNRPRWLIVPLSSLTRLARTGADHAHGPTPGRTHGQQHGQGHS
jgi:maltokinase